MNSYINRAKNKIQKYVHQRKHMDEVLNSIAVDRKNIFYFGIPMHSNLGDLAQCVCIRNFFQRNYPEYNVVEIDSKVFMDPVNGLRDALKERIREEDFIFFQSGYCTQDLGGVEDLMHQAVIKDYPDNRLVLLPQTVFFQTRQRDKQARKVYNSHNRLLFLARDSVSYGLAKEMFPDITIREYPDIVTTMIGSMPKNNKRNGILMCLRNDGEKYYSKDELEELRFSLEKIGRVDVTDTTISEPMNAKSKNLEEFLKNYIKRFSDYEVVITDRYHGTIFSLIANTPVIVIRTTDHKVTTGVDWFKEIYDSVIYECNLEDVPKQVEEFMALSIDNYNRAYFQKEYYDKLPDLIDETMEKSRHRAGVSIKGKVHQICEKENCTGCLACQDICKQNAISVTEDIQGFWHPQVNTAACIGCGMCQKICPENNQAKFNKTHEIYAVWQNNLDERLQATSGGTFFLLAQSVIDQGGVVYGAALNDKCQVEHIRATDIEEAKRLCGSKYVQSNTNGIYKKVKTDLDSGLQVLFSGTPCQISALRSYLRKDYDSLVCIDLVCHGVPSPRVYNDYLEYLSAEHDSKIQNVNFRYKKPGWSVFSMKIDFENGEQYIQSKFKDPYLYFFLAGGAI